MALDKEWNVDSVVRALQEGRIEDFVRTLPKQAREGREEKQKILVQGGGENSVMAPLSEQFPGTPVTHYEKLTMNDMKPKGLKMSSCFCIFDNTRSEMYTMCDQSVETMQQVKTPLVEIVLEMLPAVRQLGRDVSGAGLLHSKSRGGIGSWVRCETWFGFPRWMMRVEDSTIYLVGKDKLSMNKVPICRGKFVECHVDEDFNLLSGDRWEQDCDMFYDRTKNHHISRDLMHSQLHKYYESAQAPFTPTKCAKVTWMMSHAFSDLWEIIYHSKTPTLLWELNMLAGTEFQKLVQEDADPQAVSIQLPKKMTVGVTYEALCFLDERKKTSVYILIPKKSSMQASEVALAVFANYNWDAAPSDGQTIRSEDISILSAPGRLSLINFMNGEAKSSKYVDFADLPEP